jgi:endonuclease YncB( thermonuclease family)
VNKSGIGFDLGAGARRIAAAALMCAVAACGPQIGSLEQGESGRVVRAYNGDTLVLDTGLRVFLAEIDAPRGEDDYASQSQGELEALAVHREVLLAYGGAKRWSPRSREDGAQPGPESAIAHVFVRSEGGRWFWLQHALVSRGAAFVRDRPDNHARVDELLNEESRARAAARGLWGKRDWRVLPPRTAARIAIAANVDCMRGEAPFRLVEGIVEEVHRDDARASLKLAGTGRGAPFSLVVFGERLASWEGPSLESLAGTRVRARGPLGVSHDEAQLCLETARQLEIVAEG